jgi:hypothetical protein
MIIQTVLDPMLSLDPDYTDSTRSYDISQKILIIQTVLDPMVSLDPNYTNSS